MIVHFLYRIKQIWKNAYDTPAKRFKLLSGTVIIAAIINILPGFFRYIERRNGVVLHDVILAHLPACNLSIPIFAVIWGLGLLMFWRALHNPTVCLTYIWTLIFVCLARFITIYAFPLDPPDRLVPLVDPLTEIFYGHAFITKDLFFSGHTSTMVLIYLNLENKTDKLIALIATIVLVIMLLIQHIHYTIDVLAAPVIVYALYRMTKWMGFK